MCDKSKKKMKIVENSFQKKQHQQPETKEQVTSTGYPYSLLALDNEESNIVKGYN